MPTSNIVDHTTAPITTSFPDRVEFDAVDTLYYFTRWKSTAERILTYGFSTATSGMPCAFTLNAPGEMLKDSGGAIIEVRVFAGKAFRFSGMPEKERQELLVRYGGKDGLIQQLCRERFDVILADSGFFVKDSVVDCVVLNPDKIFFIRKHGP